jgi:hypothetical protein
MIGGNMPIGPYHSHEMVVCSADAGPSSQRNNPDQAQYFFPGAKWVGALRNAARRLHCDFLILTTQYGLVEPHKIITPYDLHIKQHRQAVGDIWLETVPALMQGAQYRLMIFYSGGCPRDEMIEVMLPILMQQQIALLTFGKPNMFDIGKLDTIWEMLMRGTTAEEIMAILRAPDRFKYYPVDDIAPNRV